MPAGHPGNHAITATWTDQECYDPSGAIPTPTTNPGKATVPGEPGLLVTDISEPAAKPVPRCAACSHSHKGGACKCGCYEHIG